MDHPRPFLPQETQRLVLRVPSLLDASAIQEAIEESFETLHRWMPWAAELQSLDDTKAFVESAQSSFQSGEDFAITGFLRATGQFVLGAGLHPRNWSVPKFEIGYWCRTSMQRKGFAIEAVLALTQIAFREMAANRVEIRCDSRNMPSRRVAERAGYNFEAQLRSDDIAMDGSLRDTIVYALLREHVNLAE